MNLLNLPENEVFGMTMIVILILVIYATCIFISLYAFRKLFSKKQWHKNMSSSVEGLVFTGVQMFWLIVILYVLF